MIKLQVVNSVIMINGKPATCRNCGSVIRCENKKSDEENLTTLLQRLPDEKEAKLEDIKFFCSSYDYEDSEENEKNYGVCGGERTEELIMGNDGLPYWEY